MSDRYDDLLVKMVHIISRRLEGIEKVENFLPWMEESFPEMAAEEKRLDSEIGRLHGGDYANFRTAVVRYSRHLTSMIKEYKKTIKLGGCNLTPQKAEKRSLQPMPEAGQEWHGAGQRPGWGLWEWRAKYE